MIQKKVVKVFFSILIISVMILGLCQNTLYATDVTKKVEITKYSYISNGEGGYESAKRGYALKEKDLGNSNHHPIYQVLSKDGTEAVDSIDLYCVNATSGATWFSNHNIENVPVTYTRQYDLTDKATLQQQLTGNGYKIILGDNVYGPLMWILDNIYVSKKDNNSVEPLTIKELLANAGIKYGKNPEYPQDDDMYYYDGTQYDGKLGKDGYKDRVTGEAVLLTSDMVQAVQQAAIWYFTNYTAQQQNTYNNYDEKDGQTLNWLEYITENDSPDDYKPIATVGKDSNEIAKNKQLQEQASILYNYLIDGAKAAGSNYTGVSNISLRLEKGERTLTKIDDTDNYRIGPIKVAGEGIIGNLDIKINDQQIDTEKVTIQDSAEGGQKLSEVKVGQEFYIIVPSEYVVGGEVDIDISGKGISTQKYLYTEDNQTQQPIVEVLKQPVTQSISLTATKEKNFDLALRKQIVSVGGTHNIYNEDGEIAEREINIDTSSIPETATYKHRKDPIVVSSGNTVTYRLYIYNEGDIDGFATKIIDQLPVGLTIVPGFPNTLVSGKGNTYQVEYDEEVNQIRYTLQNREASTPITKYTGGTTLDSDYIDIACVVTQEAEVDGQTKHYLTNIAQIVEEYDNQGGLIRRDRNATESTPGNLTKRQEELNVTDRDDVYNGSTDGSIFYTGKENDFYFAGQEDDDDFETLVLMPQNFDLALRKFISAVSSVNSFEEAVMYEREPDVNTSNLYKEVNGELITTATYNHSKKPVSVKVGDYVLYTIRVYNEGDIPAVAAEVQDKLPEYLDFVDTTDEYINRINSIWTYDANTRTVTTTSSEVLNPFDSVNDNGKGSGLDSTDFQIVCKVNDKALTDVSITNVAQITLYEDENGNEKSNDDIDSYDGEGEGNFEYDDDISDYRDRDVEQQENDEYIPGQEDDDDFEKLVIREQKFDLALRKFITNIEGEDVTSRIPQVKYEDGKIKYKHPKDVVKVVVGDTVTYTIRVFNEGEIAGYAEEISDDIPEYLEFLPDNEINQEYRWVMKDSNGNVTANVKDAVKISTDYRSKDYGEELSDGEESNLNLLNAFNPDEEISEENPDYVDVQVAFKVKDPDSSTYVITNKAQISEDADENGNPVDDIDSKPDEWIEDEDDQDYENVSVEYFDLALLKYVSKVMVTEGKTTTTTNTKNTGADTDIVPKVEVNKKKIKSTVVKFEYTIKITNEGDIEGYATEITDYVPEGLKFYKEDNKGWTEKEDGVITTDLLKDKLLKPGESATVKVIFRWINGEKNLGVKTNVAEISQDKNEKGIHDKDSSPGNKKDKEDDIDDADVLLSIKTGLIGTVMPYVGGTMLILVVLAGGIILIKRYVL